MSNKNTAVTTLDAETLAWYRKAEKKITDQIGKVEKGYLFIVTEMATIADQELYKQDGYPNISTYAEDKYGMAKSTAYNLCKIAKRFGDEKYKLLPAYSNLTMRQLLALMPMNKEDEKLLPENWKQLSANDLKATVDSLMDTKNIPEKEERSGKENGSEKDKNPGKEESSFGLEFEEDYDEENDSHYYTQGVQFERDVDSGYIMKFLTQLFQDMLKISGYHKEYNSFDITIKGKVE